MGRSGSIKHPFQFQYNPSFHPTLSPSRFSNKNYDTTTDKLKVYLYDIPQCSTRPLNGRLRGVKPQGKGVGTIDICLGLNGV